MKRSEAVGCRTTARTSSTSSHDSPQRARVRENGLRGIRRAVRFAPLNRSAAFMPLQRCRDFGRQSGINVALRASGSWAEFPGLGARPTPLNRRGVRWFLSLSCRRRREERPGERRNFFLDNPSLRLSPRSCLTGRESKRVAFVLIRVLIGVHPCPSVVDAVPLRPLRWKKAP
jgi:hypothetical protein